MTEIRMLETNAYYMLRRSLHLWRAEEDIREAVDYCARHDVDEVMWKIDVEMFNHGLTALDLIRQYLPWLDRARDALEQKQIKSSINPWVTLNHADRGRDMASVHPDMTWMMDADGTACTACPCPMSGAWRTWLVEAYTLYATTRPAVLWLEDDYRNFNHSPVEWGCYCPQHMAALGELIGEPIDRAQLVRRLLRPGDPDPIRSTWFDLLGRPMVEAAGAVAKAVHGESPQTRLALMCSDSLDGRWWPQAMRAMAGPHEPVARPSFSPYYEDRATALLPDRRDHHKELSCLPPDTRICPELENYPYSPYSKSARFTRLELGLSQLFGHAAITMNLFDHVGTSLSGDLRYAPMLKATKPLLSALAARCGPGGLARGVQVLFHAREADHKKLVDGDGMDELMPLRDGEGWAAPLQGSGVPVIWSESTVCCTTGQMLRAFDQDAIRRFLSGGLLLDRSALEVLHDQGLGAFTGAAPADWPADVRTPAVAESFHDESLGGGPKTYMAITPRVEGDGGCAITPAADARAISCLVDVDRRSLLAGMTLYENELGGRVAVYPLDLSGGADSYFMNWQRRTQLSRVVHWLNRGTIDLQVNGDTTWMVPVCRDYDGYTLVGIANLETDDWPRIDITLRAGAGGAAMQPSAVLLPDESGEWKPARPAEQRLENGHLHLVVDTPLKGLDFTAIVLEWS